jgi:hypothetical protein
MDALTNVVAVLILVLVLVQADVSRKVQKFLDDIQPATPEDVAQSKKTIGELERKQVVAEARLREKPATPEDIEEEKRLIALLEQSMEQNKELLADLDQVRELEKKVRIERNAESEETVAIQKEIAHLEGLLDATPPIDPDTPTVISIPNSRPIPGDAKTFHAMAIRNRLHIIDPNPILELFRREFDKNKGAWLDKRIPVKGKPDTYIYDGTKIVAHFKNFNWGNTRGQNIGIISVPTGHYLQLLIRPDLGKGGTPLEELSQPGGEFAKAIPAIRQGMRSILLYRVHPDSFKTYLAARELSERVNIAAGWEINGSQEFRMGIPDLTVKRLQDPPPPPVNPPPPAPPGPPPLKPKLD